MAKLKVLERAVADYDLLPLLAKCFGGTFVWEILGTYEDLFWLPPVGKGLYTLERVQSYVEGWFTSLTVHGKGSK